MAFGERLIELRKEKGYTRDSFAEYLGISKYTLRNYELNVNEPGSTFLMKISNIFDVSLDYLLCTTDERERTATYSLKTSEYKHIEKYRELDPHGKDIVDTVLDKEHERCVEIKKSEESNIVQSREASKPYLEPQAAHERTDLPADTKTAELIHLEDDMMDDENF